MSAPNGSSPGEALELDDSLSQCPHELYRGLHASGSGVQRVIMPPGAGPWSGLPVWLVTGYREARAALADSRLSNDLARTTRLFGGGGGGGEGGRGAFSAALSRNLLHADPPDHTRLRKLVNKAFTSRAVQRLEPRIERITADLLDQLDGVEETDLLVSYASPLPIIVICELLGIPASDEDDIRGWTKGLVSGASRTDMAAASEGIGAYLTELVAGKRAAPGDDLLSELIRVNENGDQLADEELVPITFVLLIAGHETTINLIGNGVYALLRNRPQLERLRADPALLPGAVEELLRYESPSSHGTFRSTTEDLPLGDAVIPAGELVLISLIAANRDPAHFDAPDVLDVARPPTSNLAFGHGIHHCVGAPLARMEGRIALGRLLERYPHLALAVDEADLSWNHSTLIHGLRSLPVRLNGRSEP
ncbi:cytochrome P450 [Saccharopolyspora indica]|uniref:cytochrome P450 family protein n=1 Tax=Saccharopolyspora indica TaxID=1229659 RepID=UPI0022EAD96A|nr:cytochrome P450 [Saccharopolyspora indica]MDA3649404.1 cytochrome P450 [Saccharopolyspora indica]